MTMLVIYNLKVDIKMDSLPSVVKIIALLHTVSNETTGLPAGGIWAY